MRAKLSLRAPIVVFSFACSRSERSSAVRAWLQAGCGRLGLRAPDVYRPRHPEASIFYQTFEQHFDSYVRAYEERFEPRSGPLRRVVSDRFIRVRGRASRC